MNTGLTVDFGNALFGMLADIAGDIILRTDAHGFIERASPGLSHSGIELGEFLIAPHIADLADPRFCADVNDYCRDALCGASKLDCVEFPLARSFGLQERALAERNQEEHRWFALRLRPSPGSYGEPSGAMGMLRSIAKRRSLEDRLLSTSLTDHLTGLGNRRAFLATLSERMAQNQGGVMALVDVDSFKALNLRYGPSSADEMIRAFADFLRVMLRDDHCLARLGGARFAFVLAEEDAAMALGQTADILRTFADLSVGQSKAEPTVTASAGLAVVENSIDRVLAGAERALILAGASGGGKAELAEGLPHYLARDRRSA